MLYTLFFRRDNLQHLQHYRLHWRNLFLCSRPRIKRTDRFCCQLQPESTKPNSLSDFGQTRNQSLRNNDNSANCDCVDYRPDRNKRFEVWVRTRRKLPHGNCRGYSGFVYDTGKEVARLTGPIWNPDCPWSRRCRFWCCPISPDQFILLILAELRVWQNRRWMAAR